MLWELPQCARQALNRSSEPWASPYNAGATVANAVENVFRWPALPGPVNLHASENSQSSSQYCYPDSC